MLIGGFVSSLASTLVCGFTIPFVAGLIAGGIAAIGIGVIGAIIIHSLGEGADSIYETIKEWIFE